MLSVDQFVEILYPLPPTAGMWGGGGGFLESIQAAIE